MSSVRRRSVGLARRLGTRLGKIGDLVDGCVSGLCLLGEALGELATVLLASLLELEEIGDADASIAPYSV